MYYSKGTSMMSYLILFVLLLSSLTNLQAQEISYPENITKERSSLELVITGIGEKKGEIRIAVFNSEEAYKEKEHPLFAVVLPVEDNEIVWDEALLPYGVYAIAVYHDLNTNGELDTNILGIPKEAYGFSNNARGKFGPASWKDARFKISSEISAITIQIK